MLGFTGIDGLLILAPHRTGPIKLNNRVAAKKSPAHGLAIYAAEFSPHTVIVSTEQYQLVQASLDNVEENLLCAGKRHNLAILAVLRCFCIW